MPKPKRYGRPFLVRLTVEQHARLTMAALKENRSISGQLRAIISEFILKNDYAEQNRLPS